MITQTPSTLSFRRDRFGIYWVEESTGVVYCESEKQWLIKKYQQQVNGKKKLEAPPAKGSAAKLFAFGKSL